MNFGEMQTEVARRLEESGSIYWTPSDIRRAINEGYEEISDGTEWYEQTVQLDLGGSTIDTVYYDLADLLPNTFLRLMRATNNQTLRPIEWESVRAMDNTYRRWEMTQGEPTRMFIRGLWHLGTFPHVSTDVGSLTLKFVGIPPPFVLDSEVPVLPRNYHVGVVEYATYDLLAQEAETDKALKFWQRYLTYEVGLRAWVKNRLTWDRLDGYRG